jgi:hypothetical protein
VVEQADGIVADISLPGRRLALRYPHDRLAVEATVTLADGSRRTLSVEGEGTRAPAAGWIDQLRAWVSR